MREIFIEGDAKNLWTCVICETACNEVGGNEDGIKAYYNMYT